MPDRTQCWRSRRPRSRRPHNVAGAPMWRAFIIGDAQGTSASGCASSPLPDLLQQAFPVSGRLIGEWIALGNPDNKDDGGVSAQVAPKLGARGRENEGRPESGVNAAARELSSSALRFKGPLRSRACRIRQRKPRARSIDALRLAVCRGALLRFNWLIQPGRAMAARSPLKGPPRQPHAGHRNHRRCRALI